MMKSAIAADASSRRSFLKYVGAGAAASAAGDLLGPLTAGGRVAAAAAAGDAVGDVVGGGGAGAWVADDGAPNWEPVRYPVPLPGDPGAAADDQRRLGTYDVEDALRLPNGFRYDVLAKWGDAFGPEGQRIVFGYNADYTGLVKIADAPGEYFLLVNHEYVSARPWLEGYEKMRGRALVPYSADPGDAGRGMLAGVALDGPFDLLQPDAGTKLTELFVAAARALCTAALDDLGVSILRVKRTPDGGFAVVTEATDHRRITGISRQNVTHPNPVRATGPAALIASGAPGTFANCSGATTPWGTFLTCEENFRDQVMEWVTPDGLPLPGGSKPFAGLSYDARTGLPFEFEGLGQGVDPPLDGRHFGWVCEVDPKTGVLTKHTALGRFRHENVALRVEAGKRLVAYMGDAVAAGTSGSWSRPSRSPTRRTRAPPPCWARARCTSLASTRPTPGGGCRYSRPRGSRSRRSASASWATCGCRTGRVGVTSRSASATTRHGTRRSSTGSRTSRHSPARRSRS